MTNHAQLNEKHKLFKPGQTVVDLVGVHVGVERVKVNTARDMHRAHGVRFADVIFYVQTHLTLVRWL